MFQLIVAVISIALVAALAIASIYYGGDAFQKSSLRANVVTLVNGGQQISGAAALYKTDFGGTEPASIADLNGQYLTQAPGISPIAVSPTDANDAVNGWKVSGGLATIKLVPTAVTNACAEVNRQATGSTTKSGTQFYCTTDSFVFKL